MGSRTSDASSNTSDAIQCLKQKSPDSRRVLRVGGVFAGIVTVLVAGTAAAGATGFTLLLASPLLLLFSPVLIPMAIVAALAIGGLVSFLLFVSTASWVYKYAKGRHPVGSDQVDAAKNRIVDTASQVTEKAREAKSNVTGYLQNKA